MTTALYDRLRSLARLDRWEKEQAVSALLAHPLAEIIPALERGVREQADADVRNASMEIFSILGSRAFPSLTLLIRDDDPEVRLFAANILYAIGDPATLPLLFGAAEDNDVNVRTAVAEAIGKMKDPRALPALERLLDDEPWVAAAAINSVGMIGGDEARDMLHTALQREELRLLSILALAHSGDQDSVPLLLRHMDEGDLREVIVQTIVSIGEKCHDADYPGFFRPLEDLLIDLFASPDTAVQRSALIALCWTASSKGVPCFLQAVNDTELQEYAIRGLIRTGRAAVPDITAVLKKTTGSHRVIFAKILNIIGADQELSAFFEDDDPEVRTEAALALGSLERSAAEPLLMKMLADNHEEVQAAARRSLRLLTAG